MQNLNLVDFDGISPEQQGCYRLLLGVLMVAVKDYMECSRRRKEMQKYFSSSDVSYVFSFQSICLYLKLKPTEILSRLNLKGDLK